MWRIISDPVSPGIDKSLRIRPISAWCSEKAFQSFSSTSRFKYLVAGILRGRNCKPQYSRIIINDQNRFWCVPVNQAENGNSLAMICRIWVKQCAQRTLNLYIERRDSFGCLGEVCWNRHLLARRKERPLLSTLENEDRLDIAT